MMESRLSLHNMLFSLEEKIIKLASPLHIHRGMAIFPLEKVIKEIFVPLYNENY